ncbi:unnamed protein product [Caenorhabditis nigoni]
MRTPQKSTENRILEFLKKGDPMIQEACEFTKYLKFTEFYNPKILKGYEEQMEQEAMENDENLENSKMESIEKSAKNESKILEIPEIEDMETVEKIRKFLLKPVKRNVDSMTDKSMIKKDGATSNQ